MLNITFKSVLLILVVVSLAACGGGGGGSATSVDTTPVATNNKAIYFETDFVTDSALRVTENDVAIFSLSNLSALTERIPFRISQAGNFELCMEGAGKIVNGIIRDGLNQVVLEIQPVFPLDCLTVALQAQDYSLELNYVDRIISTIGAPVPFIRLDESIELKADVETSDWDQQLAAENTRAGVVGEILGTDSNFRTCYRTPINNISLATFRLNANKLRLSFIPDLNSGSSFLCNYTTVFNLLALADQGSFGTVSSGLVNRPILTSRPKPGDRSVSILNDINMLFKDAIDRTSLDGLSVGSTFNIAPPVDGVISLSGQALTFAPATALTPDTIYSITLSGLTENGTPIDDIIFAFKTLKPVVLNGDEESLTNETLCALGVSEFCTANEEFKTISAISAAISGTSTTGSRQLAVTTTIPGNLATNDIVFEYEFIDDRDSSVVATGKFAIGYGEVLGPNLVAWPIDDFEKTAHSGSMKITKISNAFGPLQTTGRWTVYNGELYNSAAEVVTNDDGAPIITGINLSGNIASSDLALTATLDRAASEDVYIQFTIEGGCQWFILNGPELCLDAGVASIPAGSLETTVALPAPDGIRSFNPDRLITVTVANTRNVNPGAGLVATRLLDTATPNPGPAGAL